MSSRPALSGEIQSDEVTRLKREIAGLEAELSEAREEAEQAKQAAKDSIAAIRALRKQTQPLFDALQMIHGEISRVDAEAISSETAGTQPTSGRWTAWKSRVSDSERRVIEVLEIGGQMTRTQISRAAGIHYDTAKVAVKNLTGKGIAAINGDMVSLKA